VFAVIFTANINQLDAEYFETASYLRDLAINQYNCIKFIACAEGEVEIAISYWHSLEDIQKWQQNAEHLQAQAKGKVQWYSSYSVQVSEVIREYKQ